MNRSIAALAALLISAAALHADAPQREPLGTTLGRTVYHDELRPDESAKDGVGRLIVGPAIAAYRAAHKLEMTPTEAEVDAFVADALRRREAERPERDEQNRRLVE